MKTIHLSTQDHALLKTLVGALPRKPAATDGPCLADELARAVVLDCRMLPYQIVLLGSRFDIEDLESGEVEDYTLCLPAQANAEQGFLSVLAPIGTAVLGYADGDEIEWKTPGGLRRLRLRSVSLPSLAHSV